MAAVVPCPARRRAVVIELAVERVLARRRVPRLRLVPDEFEHEPEWDSEDSDAYQDRVEAGLEPEWPDDLTGGNTRGRVVLPPREPEQGPWRRLSTATVTRSGYGN